MPQNIYIGLFKKINIIREYSGSSAMSVMALMCAVLMFERVIDQSLSPLKIDAFRGATVLASSQSSELFPAIAIIDRDSSAGRWGSYGGWADGTPWAFPDTLKITLIEPIKVNYINVKGPIGYSVFESGSTYQEAIKIEYKSRGLWSGPLSPIYIDSDNARFLVGSDLIDCIRIIIEWSSDGSSRISEVSVY